MAMVMVSLVVAMEIGMVLMVLFSVVVVQMVVVVRMVVILMLVTVKAKWGEWGYFCRVQGGAAVAVADGVWKSWAVSYSFVDALAAYGCGSDFGRDSRAACGGR